MCVLTFSKISAKLYVFLFSRFSYAQRTRSETTKTGSKVDVQSPEFHKTRLKNKYYELTKEKIAQLSDESYKLKAKDHQIHKQGTKVKRPAHEKNEKRTFDYRCGGQNEPLGEMCCYKIKPVVTENPFPSNSVNDDMSDIELNDDNHLHTIPQNDEHCHRVPREPPKSASRIRARPKGKEIKFTLTARKP